MFSIQASGSIESGVRFGFFEGHEPSKLRITSLTVYRRDGDNASTEEWGVTGDARVSDVEYGIAPKGLVEQSPAVPLTIDGVYVVVAGDRVFLGPPGGGGTTFRVSRTGVVLDCGQTPECFSER